MSKVGALVPFTPRGRTRNAVGAAGGDGHVLGHVLGGLPNRSDLKKGGATLGSRLSAAAAPGRRRGQLPATWPGMFCVAEKSIKWLIRFTLILRLYCLTFTIQVCIVTETCARVLSFCPFSFSLSYPNTHVPTRVHTPSV